MNGTIEHERWSFPTDLVPVESQVIRAVRYDRDRRVLEVVFRNGRPYHYVNVPPAEYDNLLRSRSKGRYFLNNIRNAYPYWRLHRSVRPKKQP